MTLLRLVNLATMTTNYSSIRTAACPIYYAIISLNKFIYIYDKSNHSLLYNYTMNLTFSDVKITT